MLHMLHNGEKRNDADLKFKQSYFTLVLIICRLLVSHLRFYLFQKSVIRTLNSNKQAYFYHSREYNKICAAIYMKDYLFVLINY
jgi:hypothetical protein